MSDQLYQEAFISIVDIIQGSINKQGNIVDPMIVVATTLDKVYVCKGHVHPYALAGYLDAISYMLRKTADPHMDTGQTRPH